MNRAIRSLLTAPFLLAPACALEPGEVEAAATFARPGDAPALPVTDAADINDVDACDGEVPGQFLVTLARPDLDLRALPERHRLDVRLTLPEQGVVVVRGLDDAARARLARDAGVLDVRPDHFVCATKGAPPSGGGTTPPPPAELLPSGVDRVGSDELTSNRGAGTVVCVVDTGIDYTHPDLAPNYLGGKDFVNNDNDPLDDHGHGTHVSGTIAAVHNTVAVVGVAPEAKLLAAKVLNRRGSGTMSQVAAGVNYCVAQGADVINMSLGGSYNDATQLAALQNARAAGVTVVVAAGNDGVSLDTTPSYPASYDGVVFTVSAAWIDDASRALGTAVSYPTFSNYGSAVDLSAPGVYVVSTAKGGGTTTMSGTSMATPHVAGAAALYLSVHPGALPDEVEAALRASTEDVNNVSTHPEELLNVRAFVPPPPPATTDPTITP